ncbi:MAG: hypothetical protein RL150_216 [Candidatus Parcubacteria bacterium]
MVVLAVALYFFKTDSVSGETIKIGALQSINAGTASAYGEFAQRGMSLALEDLNAVRGARPIELDIQDSQAQPKVGVTAFNNLIANGNMFVIGDIFGGVTLAVAPIAEERKIIYFTPGSSPPAVTQAGDYIFRSKVSAAVEGKMLTSYLIDTLQVKRVALLSQNSQYGKGVQDTMKANLEAAGIPITNQELYEIGALDFKTQLVKIKEKKPDIVVVTGFPKEVGQMLKQAKEIGVDTQFIAHSGSVGPDIIEIAGSAADELLVLLETTPNLEEKETKRFYERHIERYGEEPEIFTLLAYDTLMILGKVARDCNADVECVKQGLYNFSGEGITGPLSFDQNGDVVRNNFTPFVIRGGTLVPSR